MSHTDSGRDLIARAIIWKDGALLVNGNTNRKTGVAYVALPGGHVDPGESCVFALEREVREEIAATLHVGELVFVSENIYPGREASEKKRHELTLVFEAQIEGEQTDANGKIYSPEAWKNLHWLPQNELETANLLPASIKEFLLVRGARYRFADDTEKQLS